MGSDVRLNSETFGIEHKEALAKLTDEIKGSGRKPYYIPAGASDHPLGGLGFARWAVLAEAVVSGGAAGASGVDALALAWGGERRFGGVALSAACARGAAAGGLEEAGCG